MTALQIVYLKMQNYISAQKKTFYLSLNTRLDPTTLAEGKL
jgi:hypothetical protein